MLSGMQVGPLAKLASGSRTNQDITKAGAGLIRGPSYAKKLTAAAWSGTWPAPGATLDLDFANNRGFVRGLGQGGVMDGITFTRASNGTFVGADGLLKSYANQGALGKNLLTFPHDFDNAAWTKTSVAIDAKATLAPNGTPTACLCRPTQASTGTYLTQTISASGVQTLSVYAKPSGYNFIAPIQNGNGIWFDLINKTFSNQLGSLVSYGYEDSVDGWVRVYITTNITTATQAQFYISTAAGLWGGAGSVNGTSGIYIWGAQLEVGTEATEYFPTNINVPRFDWASTEVIKRWNILSNTDTWILNAGGTLSGVAYTQNATISPENTSNAILLTETLSTGVHRIYRFGIPDGNAQILRTLSFFAKSNGRPKFSFTPNDADIPGAICIFDLADLTATSTNSALSTGTITDAGNGWRRVSITWTSRAYSSISLLNDSGIASYDGDGVSGIFMWGFSIEYQNTVTPYKTNGAQIPTNTQLLPTPTCNGLLIEEARTNWLLWCRDATQTQWVKTDITAAKDQTGIDGVANAASSLLATADGGTCIQTITLASGSRTGSVYLKRLTGTGTVQVSLDGTTWSTVDLSDTEWRRIVLSGTVTNPVVGIRLAVSGDAVAMDFGQVEDGAFATTPILTTGASATRSGDAASIPVNTFDRLANHGEMSFFATFSIFSTLGNSQTHVFNYSPQVDAGLLCWVVGSGSNALRWGVQTGSPTLATTFVFGQEFTVAGSYSLGFASLGKDGMSTSVNRDVSLGGLARPLLLSIGSAAHLVRQMNGTIKRLAINGFYLDNSQVAALSLSRGGT